MDTARFHVLFAAPLWAARCGCAPAYASSAQTLENALRTDVDGQTVVALDIEATNQRHERTAFGSADVIFGESVTPAKI